MRYSVLLPFSTVQPEQLLPWASLVQSTGVERLWEAQTVTVEPHQAFSHLAGKDFRIPLGIGVALMPFRHPFDAAVQATSLARMSGPLVVGYGPGGHNLQTMLRGEPYRSPLTAAREYITILRGLIRGDYVDFTGDYYQCHGALGAGETPRMEIGLGVLRERMARLAGETADAAITWLAPAHYLRETIVPALRAGAAAAAGGSERPMVPRLISMVPVGLAKPGRSGASLARASTSAHVRAPHYGDMLRRAGIDVVSATGPMHAAQALVDGGAFLSGDLNDVVLGLKEFEAAGVDELVLNLTGVYNTAGPDQTISELKSILDAVGALAPTGVSPARSSSKGMP